MHAQTADHPECHRQIRHTMERKNERNEGRKCLTSDTVAFSLGISAGLVDWLHLDACDTDRRFAQIQEQSRFAASAAPAKNLARRSAPCRANRKRSAANARSRLLAADRCAVELTSISRLDRISSALSQVPATTCACPAPSVPRLCLRLAEANLGR